MRTFEKFIVEATEADIKAMGGSNEAIAKLKARKAARGGKGFGSDGSTGSHFHNKSKPKPQPPGALAVRPPGGRGVGTTQSSYKTGPLAKRAADKAGQLVRSKNYKEPNNDEKKTASRPGSTRDGWGVKPTGDFKDPGNAAHDKEKKMSAYDKARKKRDVENKLDKEDQKGIRMRKALNDTRKKGIDMVKAASKNAVKDVDSVEGREGKSAGRMQKQY